MTSSAPSKSSARTSAGFTIAEVLITIGIVGLLVVLSIPVYESFQVRNDLGTAKNNVVQSLRRAQTLAGASDGDTSWGVTVQSGSIVLFRGASYAVRDTTYDETFTLPGTITASGTTEVVYAKFTGMPQSTGTITMTAVNGQTSTISINEKGTLTY